MRSISIPKEYPTSFLFLSLFCNEVGAAQAQQQGDAAAEGSVLVVSQAMIRQVGAEHGIQIRDGGSSPP